MKGSDRTRTRIFLCIRYLPSVPASRGQIQVFSGIGSCSVRVNLGPCQASKTVDEATDGKIPGGFDAFDVHRERIVRFGPFDKIGPVCGLKNLTPASALLGRSDSDLIRLSRDSSV